MEGVVDEGRRGTSYAAAVIGGATVGLVPEVDAFFGSMRRFFEHVAEDFANSPEAQALGVASGAAADVSALETWVRVDKAARVFQAG